MKLYATTTSERATKGQGGNEFIEIHLKDENKKCIYIVYYKQNKIELYTDNLILLYKKEIKGKRQKGE